MTGQKRKALETLELVKKIYDEDESGLLCGGFWHDFMKEVNEQIEEIERTTV